MRQYFVILGYLFLCLNTLCASAMTSQSNSAVQMIQHHLRKESALKLTLLRTLKTVLGDVKALKAEKEQQALMIDALKREVIDLKSSLMDIKNFNDEQNLQIRVIQNAQLSQNVTSRDLHEMSDRVQRNVDVFSRDILGQKQNIQTLQDTIASYGRNLSTLSDTTSVLDRNVKLLMEEDIEQNRKLSAFSETNNHQNRQIQDLNQKSVSQERKMNSVMTDNNKMIRNIKFLLDENTQRVSDINSLNEKTRATKTEVASLSQSNINHRREEQALETENSIIFRQLTALKEKNDEQDEDIDDIERENTVQTGDIKTLTAEYMAQSKLIQLLAENRTPINQETVSNDQAGANSHQPVQTSGNHSQREELQQSESDDMSPVDLKLHKDVEFLHQNVSSVNEKLLSLENNQRYIHSHIHKWRVSDETKSHI